GFHGMSMDAIATRAGVSKVSLYRRWGSKLEAVAEVMRLMSDTSVPEDHGNLAADIHAMLQANIGARDAREAARMLMRTVGELAGTPELLAIYREHLLAPRRAQRRTLVDRARSGGELRDGVLFETASAMIGGPISLSLLVLLVDEDARWSARLIEEFTSAILRGIGAERASKNNRIARRS